MKLPDLDPSGGSLAISEVLIDYDGPQLFVAKNAAGAIFLGLHCPPTEKGDTWLFARTSRHRISQVATGKISLRSAMTSYARGDLAIAISYEEDWHHWFEAPENVPDTYLPDPDSYVRHTSVPELYKLPIAASDNNDDFDLPVSVEQDMWEFDPQTVAYLKENQTPLYVVARRRQRLVADIILSDGDARHDVPLPELSKILLSLQKTVDSLAAPIVDDDWRPSAASKAGTRLDAIATFPSSFGLRIEAHQGALADEGAGALAFQRLIDLLSSVRDFDAVRSSFTYHSKSTKLQFGKLVEYLAKSGNSIRISASTGLSEGIDTTFVTHDDLYALSAKIHEINESDFDDIELLGRLKAVSLKTKFFLIENEDESISGRIDEDLLPKISGMAIDEHYLAQVRLHHSVQELTGEITTKAILMDLRETE
ncbi:hypothetical protein N6L26_06095 [Qipengyuania sp. SS22]|uniref:DUF6575 domain-containing protein n=1 Tax=Qipengyuania sp. SS22 TaxID=2979461 RepID=UPI0021E5ED3A|nr:DUF6575 domain-containing protein [Qipengyuania sp. SS22]UYH56121.1 hypothetical protein N6L26_06095 [Qipengyuania sp. SS22]